VSYELVDYPIKQRQALSSGGSETRRPTTSAHGGAACLTVVVNNYAVFTLLIDQKLSSRLLDRFPAGLRLRVVRSLIDWLVVVVISFSHEQETSQQEPAEDC